MHDRKHIACTLCGLILVALVLIGCSEDPNAVGIGLLPPRDAIDIVSAEATSTYDTTVQTRLNVVSPQLLIGQSQGLEARTILSFNALSTIPSYAILDSAKLTLRINYKFKDSSGTFGVEVHRIALGFANPTWDSVNVSGAYSDTVSGRLLQHINPQDSLLVIPLDTTLLRLWMGSDGGSIILLPTANIVLGISNILTSTVDTRAELAVSYHDSIDTLKTFTRKVSSGSFVADGVLPTLQQRVLLQSGIANRGIIRFDSIGVPAKASVTQALLEVAVDTTQSLMNTFSLDNITVYLMRKNVVPFDSVALAVTGVPIYRNGQKFYQADIRSTVQQWLLHAPNYGVLIKAGGEVTTFDRLALYGSGAAPALRPKLKIIYTLLP